MTDFKKENISPLAWSICKSINQKEEESNWPYENISPERCRQALEVDCVLTEVKGYIEAAAPLLAKMPPLICEWTEEVIQWKDFSERLLLDLTPATEHKGGWVYLIRCNQYTKIGLSINVEDRLKTLQTASPYPLVLEVKFAANKPEFVEAFLHQWFAEKRVIGEWFTLSNFDILQIKSWGSSHLLYMATRAEREGAAFFTNHYGRVGVAQEELASPEIQ